MVSTKGSLFGTGAKFRPLIVMIPYVAGVSEVIRYVCRKFDVKVIFKSRQTLRSMLTRVRDTLPPEKQSSVVY